MTTENILAAINAEIKRLQQARSLLAAGTGTQSSATKPATKRRKRMSAEARKKIAEAMRKRWARQKGRK